ncbi:MAG: hypothetical protein ACYS1A_07010 [Planctomycetota bacterium]
MESEICENCDRTIGKLEQAFVYEGHVVCSECSKKPDTRLGTLL